ncbi:MAG: 3-deoxy-7-phosphoheptulonate synthase [Bryobacterales bacterium]|nr:3-deoxy-7-phosphoheptulonate synthase [Bryobacterales bacterium]
MIVTMKPEAEAADIELVIERATQYGCRVHRSQGEERVLLGILAAGDRLPSRDVFEALPQVDRVVRVSTPYKLVSREYRAEPSEVRVGSAVFGGRSFPVIAGPCSVESEAQIFETARFLRSLGVPLLRGGAFKPRTSPYEFQGLGEEGLRLMRRAADESGLGMVTEVLSEHDLSLVASFADMLQIGSRNMQNYALLKAAGATRMPILLKRGLSATIQEFLLAAEYIAAQGNSRIVLCERGIRTFDQSTRNTCDLAGAALLKEFSHLPVIVDPSHATGRRSLVIPVSRAAVAVGADGLMVEVHPAPEEALSDGKQSLSLGEFADLQRQLTPYLALRQASFDSADESVDACDGEGKARFVASSV